MYRYVCVYNCGRARSYLRVSDVTARASGGVGVAMGDDDYVILNGDLSFYAPTPAAAEAEAAAPACPVPAAGRCAPWLGVMNPAERSPVFVELDSSVRDRCDVITCAVPTTSSTTGSRVNCEVMMQQRSLRFRTFVNKL